MSNQKKTEHKQFNPESHWDECSAYPVEDWRHEVAEDSTRLGYREWVNHQLETAEDDVEVKASPFEPQGTPKFKGTTTGRWKGGEKSNVTEVPRAQKKAESD